MRRKTFSSCSKILQEARLPMLERAGKLARLERAVLQLLPPELAPHCKVLNLKNEILVLAVSSPAWAARLRFASADLLRQLKRLHALQLRGVELKIQPKSMENQPVDHKTPRLSMRSATLIASTAETVNHPPLQDALLRLAAKTREI